MKQWKKVQDTESEHTIQTIYISFANTEKPTETQKNMQTHRIFLNTEKTHTQKTSTNTEDSLGMSL